MASARSQNALPFVCPVCGSIDSPPADNSIHPDPVSIQTILKAHSYPLPSDALNVLERQYMRECYAAVATNRISIEPKFIPT